MYATESTLIWGAVRDVFAVNVAAVTVPSVPMFFLLSTTSALSAVGSLIKESVRSEAKLKSIDHEDVKVLIEYGDYVNASIIADKETADIRDRLDRFLKEFETNYQEYVSHWTGDVRPFFEAYKLIESYFGIYLAKK